jgi:membrane protease YdiL (CAAX protease family)
MQPGGDQEGVLFGPDGVRAGWRILLFAALAYAFFALLALPWAIVMWFAPEAQYLSGMTIGFALGLGAALLAGWTMLRWVDDRPAGALGFAMEPAAPRDSLLGFGVGGAILAGAVAVLAMAGTARWVADEGSATEYAATLASALFTFGVAAAAEEAVFRGYPFQALVQGLGAWPATVIASVLFALAHGSNDNVTWVGLANIFLAGIMLSVAYLRTRSLWFATGVHLGWNWTMSALLDFPVSGLQLDTPLYSARETGADWWTGGAFGPEAGVAATLAIAAGTAWMLRTRRIAESGRMRELRPLVDARLGGEWRGEPR